MVKVLYIDDDAGLARLLGKALAADGMEVRHAASGRRGIELLGSETFDVVALDHNLISETGLDLIPEILTFANAPPIIYVTGSEDARVAVSALKAGAVDYVWKDVEGHYRDLLSESIKAALRQRQHQREREEAQRAIAAAKERAEMLLSEMNHRIANSLALVASLATVQANAVSDEAARTALNDMNARILAIAGIHRRLYTSADVRFVELDTYFKNLAEELTAALSSDARQARIKVEADPGLRLTTDRAISLAVIVTELVTNAFKYAYPAGGGGDIRVSLRQQDAGRVRLVVEDDGIGWNGTGAHKGSGLGSRIITALARGLDGTFAYEPTQKGTRARMDFAI